MNDTSAPLLSIRDLEVRFPSSDGGRDVVALDGVNLEIRPKEIFGTIGETGAGKSLTAWATIGLVPTPGWIAHGEILFEGQSIVGAQPRQLQKIRGARMAMIVQNPRGSLNPLKTIGDQIATVYRAHNRAASRKDAWELVVETLRSVGFGDAPRRAKAYPHQLSDGMAQRAMIAIALITKPRLVIADEPTSGLDVTIQAEILDLMTELMRRTGSAIWLITHDMGIIANYVERAAVMFAGEIIETAATKDLFGNPQHPYTRGLIDSLHGRIARGEGLAIGGAPPNLVTRPRGCQFQYRCPWAEPVCGRERPQLEEIDRSHSVRCVVAQRVAAKEPRRAC